jgi:hypothetical protein
MEVNLLVKKIEEYDILIKKSEKDKSFLEGKQESIFEKLKSDYNISDIEIEKLIEEKKVNLSSLENEIKNDLKEIEGL